MNNRNIIIPTLALFLAIGLVGFGLFNMNKMPDTKFDFLEPAFTLQSDKGDVKFSDIHGKVGIVFFGYTHCPDICPTTIINLKNTMDLLTDEEKSKSKFLFISLDPWRDTPEIMSKYTGFFNSEMVGLSGSIDATAHAADTFKVAFEKDKANQLGNYSMNHSTYIFITRPDGKVGNLIGHSEKPEKIAEVIRYWTKWAD
ncbi:MAG: SCO family protein [Mariprofundaceae bacterium]